jgi:hypothetical protein
MNSNKTFIFYRAKSMVEELKEKLSKETEECEAEFQRHQAAFIDSVQSKTDES